ncbi:MAG: hypothetical protein M1819_001594 [Sarea resinae]|nr:MAG: hypothetical protein M1819_001594 [Sarea resinae]
MEVLPSPPVSPWSSGVSRVSNREDTVEITSPRGSLRDPPLFSRASNDVALSADVPLFPPPNVGYRNDLVSQHMAQSHGYATKPTREEYLLALSCIPKVSEGYNRDPQKWLQREREIIDERFGQAHRVWKRPVANGLAKIAPAPTTNASSPPTRVARTTRVLPRTPKRTPPTKNYDSFSAMPASSPKQRTIGATREDTDYRSLPDYSPPLSTLPKNNPKVLKADWRGQMLDLSDDPDRHMLHEAEINLAATLRLSCATYLCSKRRIFEARIRALRIGKEFRKTDSQQACKIDVNKASKLWTAFDKVGWFKPDWFQQYI